MSQSSPAALHDQLIIVGGHNGRGELDTVHCYDATANSWKKLGSLICPKALPLVTTLTGGEVVYVVSHENYDRSFVGITVVVLLLVSSYIVHSYLSAHARVLRSAQSVFALPVCDHQYSTIKKRAHCPENDYQLGARNNTDTLIRGIRPTWRLSKGLG